MARRWRPACHRREPPAQQAGGRGIGVLRIAVAVVAGLQTQRVAIAVELPVQFGRTVGVADENRYRIAQHEIERGLARRSGVRNLVDQQAIALLAVGGRRATDAYHAHKLLGAGRDREHRWAHHQIATGAEPVIAVRLAPREHATLGAQRSSEERSVGKEGVSTCRYRWSTDRQKKKQTKQ